MSAGLVVGASSPAQAGPRVLWADTFSGASGTSPAKSSWTPEVGGGGWGNDEQESYTGRAANVRTDGHGHLQIVALRENYAGPDHVTRQWTSARITTAGRHVFQYGRITVRAKVPAGQGLWPAFWTLGSNIGQVGWPACGEMDVFETINGMGGALQSLHGPQAGTAADWTLTGTQASTSLSSSYHDYAIDWRPNSVTFLLDGKATRTFTPKDLPAGSRWTLNSPQYLLLDLAVGGHLPGNANASTPHKAVYSIDSVSVTDNGYAKVIR